MPDLSIIEPESSQVVTALYHYYWLVLKFSGIEASHRTKDFGYVTKFKEGLEEKGGRENNVSIY